MKIEFIEETKADGKVMYYTRVNGSFVDNSLSFDKSKARVVFQNIVDNKGVYVNKKVLESVTIS